MTKVLVIKLSSIGDVLASTPVFSELAEFCEVSHLVMAHCYSVTSNNQAIAKHHIMDFIPSGNRWLDLWRTFKMIFELRVEKYDVAFVLHRNISFQIICWLAGIGKIYGFSARWNPFLARHMPYKFDVNRTLQECALIRLGGFEIKNPEYLEFYPKLEVLPQELFNLLPKKFIACNPGGGNAHSPANNRMWPIEYYAELINNSSLPFVILGQGSSDRDLVDKLIQLVEPKKIVSLVGKATLSETALILKHAALYLGNDSALMFLGAAMGVQTLGLYGPTQVEAANPIGKKQYNIRSEVACSPCYDPYSGINGKMYTCTNNLCMQEIKVKTVLDKITKLLASKVGIL